MALSNDRIKEKIVEKFGDQITQWEEPFGFLTFTAPKQQNLKILQFLREDEELKFRFLTDICAVHYPDNKGAELAVVYHLHNMIDNVRVRMKIYTDIETPDVYTATSMYSGADWMERETYDFFGINFIGHPDLRRILNVDEMDYFPLRKEYPLEDQTRTDKDDEMFGRGGNLLANI